MGKKVYVDLTHPFSAEIPRWPYFDKPEITNAHTMAKGGVLTSKITCTMHTGTHCDAPRHVMEYEFDGRRARYTHEMPIDAYTGEAVVLKLDVEPWTLITDKHLDEACKKCGVNPDDLKGKEAVFTVKLNGIKEKKCPELTDEFVKANAGCETVEEYKNKCRERLERRAATRSLNETENSIIKAICEKAHAEIPDAMIEQEIDKMVQDFSNRLMYQGISLDDYLKFTGATMEQFRSQFTGSAAERVMSTLVIDKIVRTEGIKAEQDEVEAKIAEQAESVGKAAEEYKKNMDPRQLSYIESDIIITKLFDFLKANNDLYTE